MFFVYTMTEYVPSMSPPGPLCAGPCRTCESLLGRCMQLGPSFRSTIVEVLVAVAIAVTDDHHCDVVDEYSSSRLRECYDSFVGGHNYSFTLPLFLI